MQSTLQIVKDDVRSLKQIKDVKENRISQLASQIINQNESIEYLNDKLTEERLLQQEVKDKLATAIGKCKTLDAENKILLNDKD